jgi:endonuclease YncB( thermonuclease family)
MRSEFRTVVVLAAIGAAVLVVAAATTSAAVLMAAAPATSAAAEEPPAVAFVRQVIDGEVLATDAGEVRLAGIMTPTQPPALANQVLATLRSISIGRTVTLGYETAAPDRHGRYVAQVETKAGIWLQGTLLERGLARVATTPDRRARAAEMLARERAAREAGRGLWGHPAYRILSEADAADHIGAFQLVEGRVLAVQRVKGVTYLNFGPDYRTDFTVQVPRESLAQFGAADVLLPDLKDQRVRVRGWLRQFNGPLIDATHPEQIEVLGQ